MVNGPGRPPVYGHDDVLLLVKTVTEPPPDEATRWTMEAIAEAHERARGADLGVAGVADLPSLWISSRGRPSRG